MSNEIYVKAVLKALDILEHLGKGNQERGCLEIGRQLNMPSSTAHRLLATLEMRGYVRQNTATGGYRLGSRVLDLQERVAKDLDIKQIAQPYLLELAQLTREGCNLGILDDKEVVHIKRVESPEVIRASIRTLRFSAFTSAIGQLLLAYLPEGQLAGLLPEELPAQTPNSITDKKAFLDRIQQIKKQGFSVDNEEGFIGVRAVAVPILNHRGKVIAGLGVIGPTERMDLEKIEECRLLLSEAAANISRELGYDEGNDY
ncbi:IclR family transcriptional regulator [Desulfotomaculum sp. 1211_IL3151]|uniref:IclR family transcriptional regulator n=1 Tax=Desulfotomaculum sp. 1211_IL3151 TaxID=3084055 RepID=UPI002FD91EFF